MRRYCSNSLSWPDQTASGHLERLVRHLERLVRHLERLLRHLERLLRHLELLLRHLERSRKISLTI